MFIRRAFSREDGEYDLQMVCGGEEAINYLSGKGHFGDRIRYPLPCLLITDLKMPKKNGFEIMVWLKTQEALADLAFFFSIAHATTTFSYC